MAQVSSFFKFEGKSLGLYRESIGFENPLRQVNDLNSFAKQNNTRFDITLDIAEPAFTKIEDLTSFIIDHSIGCIVCWRLDCLSRHIGSLEELLAFLAYLSKKNVVFITLEDGLNTDSESSQFINRLHIAWHNLKRSRKIENARASSYKAQNRGHRLGRKRIRDNSKIQKLRREGLTIREIAAQVHLSTTAVQRALKETTKDTTSGDKELQT